MTSTTDLLGRKASEYRQNLRADSQKLDALNSNVKRGHRAGGIKQHQIVRSDSSRAYQGFINIANALKAEAELAYREEYLPFYTEVEAERSKRRAKGFDDRMRKWQSKKLDGISSRISSLKRQANDLANTVEDHHYYKLDTRTLCKIN